MKVSDQVEAATGADRELDALIGVAIGRFRAEPNKGWLDRLDYIEIRDDGVQCHPGNGFDQLVPHYTASIYAALTLVPEGGYPAAVLLQAINYCDIADPEQTPSAFIARLPAFICAAALRARGL